MKVSQIFFHTTKDNFSEANTRNHNLLLQGGFIRQVAAGRFVTMPLGMRVIQKIVRIIEEELNAIGAQRLELPIMQPIEIWKITNRDKAFGDEMIITEDHYGRSFALSATAEALMTELFKGFNPSYKDLPINVYQFLQKFRDEVRPRGGLIRAREFLMKDGYNFEKNNEDFMKTFNAYYHAYEKIFKRIGLDVVPVLADNGALGGDLSYEFMVVTPEYEVKSNEGVIEKVNAGGDKIIMCDSCDYKANVEKAEFQRESVNMDQDILEMKVVDQPEWVCTMEDNVKHYSKPVSHFLKNVVYKTKDGKIVIAAVRGDIEANPLKISRILGLGNLEMASDEDLEKMGTKSGWVHSWGHDNGRDDVIYVADEALEVSRNLIGGQKELSTDTINVNFGRDFKCKFVGDIALVSDGAKCKFCKDGHLHEKKTIEVGHIFKYDDYYSTPHKAMFVDQDGKLKPMLMGAYGIGVSRTLATCVEMHNHGKGIIWPISISPYEISLISLGNSEVVKAEAANIHEYLMKSGFEVLWDDREDVSAGVKFSDCDLIGMPIRIVVSERNLNSNQIEIKVRESGKTDLISNDLSKINDFLTSLIKELSKDLYTKE